jgi:hypothetical protein
MMDTAKGRLINHGFFFDQLKPGDRFYTMGRTVTETDLVSFVNLSWLNEEGFVSVEPETPHTIQGRFVPGVLVYAMAEGLLAPTMQMTGQAFLHTELNHKGPCVVGDTIHVEVEVTESRPASKGNRGLVRTFNRVVNQRGETVLEYTPLRLMKGSPGRQAEGAGS